MKERIVMVAALVGLMATVPVVSGEHVSVGVPAKRAAIKVGAPHAVYHAVFRDGRGRVTAIRDATNLVTRTGATQIITQTFKTQTAPGWAIGEVIAAPPTFSTTDTMGSHAGWTEESSGTGTITNATRPLLSLGAVSNSTDQVSASNGAGVVFTQNSTTTVYGFYLVDNTTVGGTAGNLYGESTFASPAPVAATYTVTVTVTIQTSAG